MKILSLYINEQGVIFGSDQMPPKEPPKFQSKEWYQKYSESFNEANPNQSYSHDCREYEQSLTLWKSQAIRFENQEEAREVFKKAFFESNSVSSIVFQPGSILPLSNPIECELVGENIAQPPHTAYINQMLSIKSQPVKEEAEDISCELLSGIEFKTENDMIKAIYQVSEYIRKQHFTITRK